MIEKTFNYNQYKPLLWKSEFCFEYVSTNFSFHTCDDIVLLHSK